MLVVACLMLLPLAAVTATGVEAADPWACVPTTEDLRAGDRFTYHATGSVQGRWNVEVTGPELILDGHGNKREALSLHAVPVDLDPVLEFREWVDTETRNTIAVSMWRASGSETWPGSRWTYDVNPLLAWRPSWAWFAGPVSGPGDADKTEVQGVTRSSGTPEDITWTRGVADGEPVWHLTKEGHSGTSVEYRLVMSCESPFPSRVEYLNGQGVHEPRFTLVDASPGNGARLPLGDTFRPWELYPLHARLDTPLGTCGEPMEAWAAAPAAYPLAQAIADARLVHPELREWESVNPDARPTGGWFSTDPPYEAGVSARNAQPLVTAVRGEEIVLDRWWSIEFASEDAREVFTAEVRRIGLADASAPAYTTDQRIPSAWRTERHVPGNICLTGAQPAFAEAVLRDYSGPDVPLTAYSWHAQPQWATAAGTTYTSPFDAPLFGDSTPYFITFHATTGDIIMADGPHGTLDPPPYWPVG